MSDETVVLITGANRGLGLGLATLYLNQPNTRVILTTRTNDPSTILNALPQSYPGTLHGIYEFDSASTADAVALRNLLLLSADNGGGGGGLSKIDIIIANAGVGEPFDTLLDASMDALEAFYQVNALGPLRLYQQLWKDLLANSENPKFVLVSSVLGSLAYVDGTPCGGYGASKAAGNYFVRKMHEENRGLVAVTVHPGWVKTDNGQAYANAVNVPEPPTDVEASVNKIFQLVSGATREGTSGKFIDVMSGSEIPW